MDEEIVTVEEAIERYDELIERVSDGDAFIITRNGQASAVMLSYEAFEKIYPKPPGPAAIE